MITLAIVIAALLAALAALHLFWAFGGRWGSAAAIPTWPVDGTPLFSPGLVATLGVAVALATGAALVLVRVGLITPPAGPIRLYRAGVWALGAAFALRAVGDFRYVGAFKRVRGTPFARRDTRLYSPLCAFIAASILWMAART